MGHGSKSFVKWEIITDVVTSDKASHQIMSASPTSAAGIEQLNMLKWAFNPALRPTCEPNVLRNKLGCDKSSHDLTDSRQQQSPAEATSLPCPGRRRSLGSLLGKEAHLKVPAGSRNCRKSSVHDKIKAPGTKHDHVDTSLKSLSLTRSQHLERELALSKESPLKRLLTDHGWGL